MAFTEITLVMMTFVTLGFSLPLSNDDTTPVNCFTTEAWTPVDNLLSITYDFCTNNFPTDRLNEQISLSRGFELGDGQKAVVSIDLDPVVADWSLSECLYLLSNIVSECKDLYDVSPGGEYSPIGSGASRFKISVENSESKLARSLPNPAAYHFDPTEDTSSKVQISCDATPTEPEAVTIPSKVAMQTVEDHCAAIDGLILKEGEERSLRVESVTPSVFVLTKAMRSVTLTKDGCLRAMTPLIWVCTDLYYDFYGGVFPDTLIEWSVTLSNPALARKSIGEHTRYSEEVTPSTQDMTSEPFNSTESTKGLFKTKCNAGPWNEGAMTIDYDTAYRAMDYRCFFLQGRSLAKDGQIPLTFTDTDPWLFANTIASEAAVLTAYDCKWAYDTLFKACNWDGRYYGGLVEVGSLVWTLDLLPKGNVPQTGASTVGNKAAEGEIAIPDHLPTSRNVSEPFNSTELTSQDDKNVCFNVLGHSQKYLFAMVAAWNLCVQTGNADWDKGQVKTWTLQEQVIGEMVDPPIKVTMEAVLSTGMTRDICYETFGYYLIVPCTVQDIFFGGTHTSFGMKYTAEILDPIGDEVEVLDREISGTTAYPPYVLSPAPDASLSGLKQRQADNCVDNGVAVNRDRAYTDARDMCLRIGTVNWSEGDGLTHLYQYGTNWISARVVASQDTAIGFQNCWVAFDALINTCNANDLFTGGYIDRDGAKWSLQAVSPQSHAIEARADKVASQKTGIVESRAAAVNPYDDGLVQCHLETPVWVKWWQAFHAGILFCRSIDGQTVQPGDEQLQWHEEGLCKVSTLFNPASVVTVNYQMCIEMFDAAIKKCKVGDQTWGATIDFGDYRAAYHPKNLVARDEAVASNRLLEHGRNNSNIGGPVIVSSNDDPPEMSGCIRAESTPISKETAAQAIQEFCPKYDGSTIAAGQSLSDTIGSGSNRVAMRVTAMGADYMLYPQNCYGSFMSLLSACSDGADDEDTRGGTLMGGPAAFTLTRALV